MGILFMRSIVKTLVVASAIAIVWTQPGADAARTPFGTIEAVDYAPQVIEFTAAPEVSLPRQSAQGFDEQGFVGIDAALAAIELGIRTATLAAPHFDIPLPSARPRLLRPAAPINQVKFDGVAGAPFAHVRFCLNNPAECRAPKMVFRGGPTKLTGDRQRELTRVNLEINRAIISTNMHESPAQEKWLISPANGDCNDYAVTKRHELMAKGWPARNLLLAEVVTNWGEHHLILVVRTTKGDMVLDNLNPKVVAWTKPNYEWVRVSTAANPKFWSKVKARDTEVAAIEGHTDGKRGRL